ncbi:MAG: nuclear transport factor 2 family protein [Treponema sp.]|nr:nuclear transport factor 2 family protein [Treponema sp.]
MDNTLHEREKIIRLWFDLWLTGRDSGIADIFAEDVVYTESWGPKYENRATVQQWFAEWNTRGRVVAWDIVQFFHKDNQTVVEWHFKCEMNDGSAEEFDGISVIAWTPENMIQSIREFGCNCNNYNPYQCGAEPQFKDEKAKWF